MHNNFRYIFEMVMVFSTMALVSCSPLKYMEKEREKSCIESAEKYMDKKDAERFCKQPAGCRNWWDDLSEDEKKEIQPPIWKKDPNWPIRCDSNPAKNFYEQS